MNRKKEIMNVSVEDKNRPLQIEDQNEKWQNMGQHHKFKDLTVLSYDWCLECQWQENRARKLEKYAKDIPKGFGNKGLHS